MAYDPLKAAIPPPAAPPYIAIAFLVDVSINAKVEVRPFLVYAIAKTKDGGMS